MKISLKTSQGRKTRRALRVRKNIRGTGLKPRLSVHKSNRHIQAQLIDDEEGKTLGMAATFSKDLCKTNYGIKNKESAKKIGEMIANIAKGLNIKEVVFDRGMFKYHGILAELADAARSSGLRF